MMMKKLKAILLALAMGATLSGVALAQNDRDNDRDRDRDRDHARDNHRRWQGRHDNGLHRGWYKDRDGDRDDRYRYRGNSYYSNQGYYNNGYYNNGYYNNGYGNNGYYANGYGNGGYNGNGYAAQFGYRDGLEAGRRDRMTGHSYRPYQWAAYRDADHGMSISGYGNSGFYRQQYRQAFLSGYNQGYGSAGYSGYFGRR
jgi:hypothetical protein